MPDAPSDSAPPTPPASAREVVDGPARVAEVGLPSPIRTVAFDAAPLRENQAPPVPRSADVRPTVVRGTPGAAS
jgi:hypothetical protein